MKTKKAPHMHTGLARQKRDGSWWFCTRMAKQYKYHWPIGNASSADIKPGQLVQVIKRPYQSFCFIPVQLDIFKHQINHINQQSAT